ncbi:hypothetical protein ACP4OV_014163 [Aristida adscensionis]
MMAAGSSNPYFEHEDGSDGMDNRLGGAGLEMILLPVQPDATASDVSVHEPVDWDALQIIETIDDEGRLEVPSDEQMYVGLGLAAEDERAKKATEATATRSASTPPNIDVGVDGAAIPVDDFIPNERVIAYDPDKPEMKLGALFPSMEKFRLAVRQYAFNEEFELDVRKSTPTRYDGYCLGSTECSWHVHARPERRGGDTIIVSAYTGGHTCTSSMRRKTTNASAKWVASKAVSILTKYPSMRPIELKKKLEDDHKCTIGYDTVWRGMEKAMAELYGSWEDSFGLLYRWRAEVMKRMPSSVIEIDVEVENGRPFFRRFFVHLDLALRVFWTDVDHTLA